MISTTTYTHFCPQLECSPLNIYQRETFFEQSCREKWNIHLCPVEIFHRSYGFRDNSVRVNELTRNCYAMLTFPKLNVHQTTVDFRLHAKITKSFIVINNQTKLPPLNLQIQLSVLVQLSLWPCWLLWQCSVTGYKIMLYVVRFLS
jgi:hypothetical protein